MVGSASLWVSPSLSWGWGSGAGCVIASAAPRAEGQLCLRSLETFVSPQSDWVSGRELWMKTHLDVPTCVPVDIEARQGSRILNTGTRRASEDWDKEPRLSQPLGTRPASLGVPSQASWWKWWTQCQFLGFTPGMLHQNLWGGAQASLFLNSSGRGFKSNACLVKN